MLPPVRHPHPSVVVALSENTPPHVRPNPIQHSSHAANPRAPSHQETRMIRTTSTYLSRFFLFAAFLALAIHSPAQVVSGTISGTVTDPSGAVIANAKVVVHNDDTGVQRTLTTSGIGTFTAP